MAQHTRKGFGRLAALIAIVFIGFAIPPTLANPVSTDNTTVQLLSEVAIVQPGQPFWVALRMRMREGWHTYWRNPGDTGAPTTLNWSLPEGFKATDIHWPYPERIPYEPLVNYGYHGEVALLVGITPPNDPPTSEATLTAKAQWLVCADICIPEQAELALTLPVRDTTPAIDQRWTEVFAKARRALPQAAPSAVAFTSDADQLKLRFTTAGSALPPLKTLEFFPFDEGVIEYAAPQLLSTDEAGVQLVIGRGASRNTPLEHVRGVLVLRTQEAGEPPVAFEIDAMPIGSTALVSTAGSTTAWTQQFLLAFLGGLILNLMPCVFPVLSIKALSIVDKSRKAPAEVRKHGLVFSAGVLSCFAVIGVLLIALRYGGAQIGWGFQLQSPLFVTLLAYLMFAVGLSFSGFISIGDSLMNIGGGLAARAGYAGSFFTGALATLVATPCSAPFMGTALGFALAQPWPAALGIFQGLGLGLAFPYLLLSFFPTLFRLLPKPGPWMARFKEFLAFPMYGTAVWLLWVLTQQTGSAGIAAALTGLVLIAFAAWLFQTTRHGTPQWRSAGNLGAVAALLVALVLVAWPASSTPGNGPMPVRTAGSGPVWEPFSRQRLSELRTEGRPVFLNFTAAWCITCLVNERVALSSPRVAAAFAERNIAYLKADWTNQDAAISKALEEFGRSGVPLYVYYPPGARSEPRLLPQLLTEAMVLDQLDPTPPQASLGQAGY